MYISTICTNPKDAGAGNIIIHSIKNVCDAIGVKIIKLTSVPKSIGFYEKMRFVCDRNGDCVMNVNGPPELNPEHYYSDVDNIVLK